MGMWFALCRGTARCALRIKVGTQAHLTYDLYETLRIPEPVAYQVLKLAETLAPALRTPPKQIFDTFE